MAVTTHHTAAPAAGPTPLPAIGGTASVDGGGVAVYDVPRPRAGKDVHTPTEIRALARTLLQLADQAERGTP